MTELFNGIIEVSDGQFTLETGELNDDWDARFEGQANGLLGVAVPGVATFITGLQGGITQLRVELLDAEPPLDRKWQEIVEGSLTPLTPEGQFTVLYVDEPILDVQLPAECYRLRYGARNFDAGADEGEVEGEPMDEYLLQMWPAPGAPDRIIKVTGEEARGWHEQDHAEVDEYAATMEAHLERDRNAPPMTDEERAHLKMIRELLGDEDPEDDPTDRTR